MIFALRVLPRAKLAHARKGSTCGRLTMQACFGGYELDQERRELRFHDAPVHVEPQVFDLLLHLVANRDRVVSKDEMVGAIWGGRIVSDVTLNSRINAARRAIGDDGKTQALIRTVPRRGFRFVGQVSEKALTPGAAVEGAPGAGQASTGVPAQRVRFCRSADGVNLAVATCGDGFPVVRTGTWLTHIQRDWESAVWAPFFQRLAARFCLVRYDPRGCGLSDRQAPDISFDGFVRDLEAVVDALRLERFALFGTSQGAAVSIAYAARHPDRVTHLILSGGFALGWRRRGSAAEIATREALVTLIEQGWGHHNPAFRQVFTARLWPDATAGANPLVRRIAAAFGISRECRSHPARRRGDRRDGAVATDKSAHACSAQQGRCNGSTRAWAHACTRYPQRSLRGA